MSKIFDAGGIVYDVETDVLVIGAGACGLVAGLAARDLGANVVVLERDATPSGSTALSSGFIPAAPTRFQAACGIDDTAALFAHDIMEKSNHQADLGMVETIVGASGGALEWLADVHGLEWHVLNDFRYPGHSRFRMHAVPERTGAALMTRLLAAAETAEVTLALQAHVTGLYATSNTVKGAHITRRDGNDERVGCKALVLASSGYGGNAAMVARYIPKLKDALFFGHEGNQGDAVIWGEALGGEAVHMSAGQGHGSIAVPHGILITWALMTEGAILVNVNGERFVNEHQGYSEAAIDVLQQRDGFAWCLFDAGLHDFAMEFEDFRQAVLLGAIKIADSVQGLARSTGLPEAALAGSLRETASAEVDRFGRNFADAPALQPPYCAIKVTGALLHTQGGLKIDARARVIGKRDGRPLANLFAGGGAACGVSGSEIAGYLSGNGLLSAVVLGRIAGRAAAELAGMPR